MLKVERGESRYRSSLMYATRSGAQAPAANAYTGRVRLELKGGGVKIRYWIERNRDAEPTRPDSRWMDGWVGGQWRTSLCTPTTGLTGSWPSGMGVGSGGSSSWRRNWAARQWNPGPEQGIGQARQRSAAQHRGP